MRAASGDPLYYTSQIIDLSELKRAEFALLDRERILGRLVAIQQEIGSTAMNEEDLVPLIVDRACELLGAEAATVEMVDDDARSASDSPPSDRSVLRVALRHEGRGIGILEVRAKPGEGRGMWSVTCRKPRAASSPTSWPIEAYARMSGFRNPPRSA